MAPFTLNGRIWLEQRQGNIEPVLSLVQAELQKQHPLSIERRGDTIHFRAGLFRSVSSWNILVPIDQGTVRIVQDIEGTALVYRLRYGQLFVIASLMTLGLVSPVAWAAPDQLPFGTAGTLVVMWSWLFGANL